MTSGNISTAPGTSLSINVQQFLCFDPTETIGTDKAFRFLMAFLHYTAHFYFSVYWQSGVNYGQCFSEGCGAFL